MLITRGVARLGILAVGLGVGAAVAQSPVASADASSDWLSSVDSLLGGAVPAPSSGLDLDISYDGYTLFQQGSAFAETTPGDYDLAIADGADSDAFGYGTGNSAIADGSGAYAFAGGGTGDHADAYGTDAHAEAGGDDPGSGADYDTAIDIGNNNQPSVGVTDGAYAGNGDLDGLGNGTGSGDTAIDIGNNTNVLDSLYGGDAGAFAGAAGGSNGNNDTAIDVGNNSGDANGSFADDGNDNTAIADTSYTSTNNNVIADGGNDNYAYAYGPDDSNADASIGDSNIAYVLDPFGSTTGNAFAGLGGNSDLAAVLFTDGTTQAQGTDLYDILTAFGLESGTF